MTECQGCGAWNDTSRTLCVLCGTPLAETDEWDAAAELPPLPPLPDGGLRASMPSWLREPPQPPSPVTRHPSPVTPDTPLGPRADPRTFLTDEDFPRWLRDLAARHAVASGDASSGPMTAAGDHPAPAWPGWPGPATMPAVAPAVAIGSAALTVVQAPAEPAPVALTPVATAQAPTSAPDGRPPASVVAARALEERRGRDPWETLLLVLLLIGVIVAALWALVSNGAFSPGL